MYFRADQADRREARQRCDDRNEATPEKTCAGRAARLRGIGFVRIPALPYAPLVPFRGIGKPTARRNTGERV